MKSNSGARERGLLGLAFIHRMRRMDFLVNYSNSGVILSGRYSRESSNPNLADPNSEMILMTVTQPFTNHNGGHLAFGPDGYLYIGLGDGGSGGDPGDRAQNGQERLGKMMRIDVDNGTPFAIPPDNPFVGNDTILEEIWALGVRNPWRYSFDRLTGDLWIGDVGQDAWEEIDFQPAGSAGGQNYGWRCKEGLANFNTAGCPPSDLPIGLCLCHRLYMLRIGNG
jgi:glucose/arabinose dehydrogenase